MTNKDISVPRESLTEKVEMVLAAARHMVACWPLSENVRVSRNDMCQNYVWLMAALEHLDEEEPEAWPLWLLPPEALELLTPKDPE